MMNRIFLGMVILASISWLTYVSLDILSENNNYTPEYLFALEDEKVLIINRPSEVNIDILPDFSNAPLAGTYRSLDVSVFETAYLSANQAQLLLLKPENWKEEDIKALFSDSLTKVEMKGSSFTAGTVLGRFYKKNLYLYQGDVKHNEGKRSPYSYDKKASASIIHLSKEKGVRSVTDVYLRGDQRIDYITYNDDLKQGNQVQDELLFANVVTHKFSEYHFRERDFYAGEDSIFAQGAMFRWMQNGFLELEYAGATVLISDYIDGQDPLLILNDLNQTLDVVRFNNRLTSTFPTQGQHYFVKYLEDLVVLSEDESVCDKVVADFKLGNTIALNKAVRFQVFGALPGSVSERIVTKSRAYSRAVYRGKLLETQMGEHITVEQTTGKSESLAMNCGFAVADFAVLPKTGNIVVVGNKGEVARFKDGKLQWSKRLNREALGGVQLIDLHESGELFVLVTTRNEIHLWNLNGEEISGFPILLEEDADLPVKFYRWKGNGFFLQVTKNQKISQFDAKGRELHVIKLPITPTRPLDVWVSNNGLYVGAANNSQFAMINLDRREIYREFAIPGACFPLKASNELFQYGVQSDLLYKINQKGVRMDFKRFNSSQIIGLQSEGKNNVLILKSANELHLLNPEGIPFCQINLSFNEVEDVFVQTFASGKTITAVIDGLENNVYLYALDGSRLKHHPMEGQTKVYLNSEGDKTVITTVLDQYVVQYFE